MRLQLDSIPLIFIAVLAYSLWNSAELINTWLTAPVEYGIWIAWLIWLAPAPVYFILEALHASNHSKTTTKASLPRKYPAANYILLGFSIGFSLFGLIASLHTFHYFGLALAISALIPWTWRHIIWILCSAIWMPGLGWTAVRFFPHANTAYIIIGRILASAVCSIWMAAGIKKHFNAKLSS